MKQFLPSTHTPRHLLYATMLLGLAACSGADDPSLPEPTPAPTPTDTRICWSVKPEGMQSGRALVEDEEALQKACTPTASSGLGKAIGIWSAYEKDGVTTPNVLGNENGDVSLIYQADTEWDNWEGWTYGKEAAQWVEGATYHFKAYFPMDAIEQPTSTNHTTLTGRYNTESCQEDLMLAYTQAAEPVTPVELQMRHALSALRFRFRFDNEFTNATDKLTRFWLENTTTEKGLRTQGALVFSMKEDGESLVWEPDNYPTVGTPFYQWTDNAGIAISSSTDNMATAYTTGSALYADNDGWLLIVPQESDGTVNICFTTESAGSAVHRVALPLYTKTGINGMDETGTLFLPSYRYTYNLVITPTTVTVTLSIAAWNELESSYDINF